jgi:hypothetical protein
MITKEPILTTLLSTELELRQLDANRSDHFMRGWVDLNGFAGLSNYIHIFTSGHFMWFMEEYWNLHQLSQQGFESMNDLVTSFFFQRTQRGSFTARHNPKSKLLPIAHWLQQ